MAAKSVSIPWRGPEGVARRGEEAGAKGARKGEHVIERLEPKIFREQNFFSPLSPPLTATSPEQQPGGEPSRSRRGPEQRRRRRRATRWLRERASLFCFLFWFFCGRESEGRKKVKSDVVGHREKNNAPRLHSSSLLKHLSPSTHFRTRSALLCSLSSPIPTCVLLPCPPPGQPPAVAPAPGPAARPSRRWRYFRKRPQSWIRLRSRPRGAKGELRIVLSRQMWPFEDNLSTEH